MRITEDSKSTIVSPLKVSIVIIHYIICNFTSCRTTPNSQQEIRNEGNIVIMSWLTLPELIFSEIMLMVGLGSLESLHRCRQVCTKWNESIMVQIWGNPSKKKIMKEKIEKSWAPELEIFPSDEEISHAKWLEARAILDKDIIKRMTSIFKTAHSLLKSAFLCYASLAHHGLLDAVDNLELHDDLSFVPAQHLASLVSCVTKVVSIKNVRGCDLVSIFTSLKCDRLVINNQSLGREETGALVQAMESGVRIVILGAMGDRERGGEVTLDIGVLTEYNGQGRCCEVNLYGGIVARYGEEIRAWARSGHMRITRDYRNKIQLQYIDILIG